MMRMMPKHWAVARRSRRGELPIIQRIFGLLLVLSLVSAACGNRADPVSGPQSNAAATGEFEGASPGAKEAAQSGGLDADASDAGAYPVDQGGGIAPGAAIQRGPAAGAPVPAPSTGVAPGGRTTSTTAAARPGTATTVATSGPVQPGVAAAPAPAGPAGSQGAAADASQAGVGKTIVVGGVFNGPGPLDSSGAWEGTAAYFASLNERGGVNGYKFRFVKYIDNFDPQRHVAAVKRLIEVDKVVSIVGHISDYSSESAAQLTADAGIPVVGGWGVSNAWFSYPNWFSLYANQRYGYPGLAIKAMAEDGAKKVAIFYVNVPPAQAGARYARKYSAERGMEVVFDQAFGLVEPDYTGYVQRIKASGATHVFLMGAPDHIIRYWRAAGQQGFDAKTYAPTPVYNPSVPAEIGKIAAGKLNINTNHSDPELSDPKGVAQWRGDMKKFFPNTPLNTYTIDGWSSGEAFAEAVRRLGSKPVTPENLMTALRSFKAWKGTFNPPVTFSDNGPTQYPTMCQWIWELTETGWVSRNKEFQCLERE